MIEDKSLLRKVFSLSGDIEKAHAEGSLCLELPISGDANSPLKDLQSNDEAATFFVVQGDDRDRNS